MSAFDQYRQDAWPHHYKVQLTFQTPLCGGVPGDPKKAESWLRTKFAANDDLIRSMVAEAMTERGIDADAAIEAVASEQHANGFKRRDDLGLYIEGRQIKSSIREAVNIAVASEKIKKTGWGATKKQITSFVAEHVVVMDDIIPLGVYEADGVQQRFIHKFLPGRGPVSAIHMEEYVDDATIRFTIATDYEFPERDWAMLWLTGEYQGIGASRSQGFGRYHVDLWTPGQWDADELFVPRTARDTVDSDAVDLDYASNGVAA